MAASVRRLGAMGKIVSPGCARAQGAPFVASPSPPVAPESRGLGREIALRRCSWRRHACQAWPGDAVPRAMLWGSRALATGAGGRGKADKPKGRKEADGEVMSPDISSNGLVNAQLHPATESLSRMTPLCCSLPVPYLLSATYSSKKTVPSRRSCAPSGEGMWIW